MKIFYHVVSFEEFMKANATMAVNESNWSIENNWTLTKEILDIPVDLQQGIIKDLSVKLLAKWC